MIEKEKKFLDAAGLIALRKTEFFYRVTKEAERREVVINEEKVKKQIAEMDNEKFMSAEERKTKKLIVNTELELLDLNLESFLIKK